MVIFKKSLVVRLHSNQSILGVDQKFFWNVKAKNICIDEGYTPINKLICKSRIIVSTYNATSFLDTLALNIPTVMFWNIDKSPINNKAEPYFSMLKNCGIFHSSPESAAEHISLIWNRVSDWWESDDVQDARVCFCNHFSRNVDNPISFIHDIISKKIVNHE